MTPGHKFCRSVGGMPYALMLVWTALVRGLEEPILGRYVEGVQNSPQLASSDG